jgi:transcriptional regulator with XRE-family HTH domain
VNILKDRIKAVRKEAKLNQTEFGKSVGVTLSAEQKWELGISVPSDAAIMNICQKYNVDENWLRTGEGLPRSARDELQREVDARLPDRSDSFRSALVSTLMKFDPDGKEWEILEKIFNQVSAEMETVRLDNEKKP